MAGGRHPHVIRSLPQVIVVVRTKGVPEAVQLSANRFNVLLHRLSAVLGVLSDCDRGLKAGGISNRPAARIAASARRSRRRPVVNNPGRDRCFAAPCKVDHHQLPQRTEYICSGRWPHMMSRLGRFHIPSSSCCRATDKLVGTPAAHTR